MRKVGEAETGARLPGTSRPSGSARNSQSIVAAPIHATGAQLVQTPDHTGTTSVKIP
jgi:hypothetical protein